MSITNILSQGKRMRSLLTRYLPAALITIFSIGFATAGFAQGPGGRTFGFGLIVGDPTGGTVKIWLQREQALDFYIGGDYFGAPRIGGDYLWHFFPFNTDIANMYAGVGGTLGLGYGGGYWYGNEHGWYYRPNGGSALGVRALIGVNVMPRRTPLELFFELGPLLGITPGYGYGMDVALGVRFYP